jgi:hypothetical protein
MKSARFILLFVCLLVGLTVMPIMVQAAYTLTVTEAQINTLYSGKVIATTNYVVSNITADLQPGKVVINAKILPKIGGAAANGKLTLKPTVSGGKVTWSILSATLNGVPATGSQMTSLNSMILSYWTAFMNLYYSGKTVNSVTITATQISAVIN